MIDEISLKIISELRHNARASNIEIARKLGISMATVAKKINTMVKKGIIVIKAIPNKYRLEYHSHAFIGLSVDPRKIDSVYHRLKEEVHVHMVTTSLGRYDILLIVFFEDLGKLQDFVKAELPQIEGVNRVDPYYVLVDVEERNRILPTKRRTALINELDQRIIAEVIKDGRLSYTKLASKLGVSKSTISRRMILLLKENVISFMAVPNPFKLGYSANAYVLVNTEYTKINSIHNQLCNYPEVHLILKLINGYDLLLGIYSPNLDILYDFLENKIGNINGVSKIETCMCRNSSYFNTDIVFPFSIR